MGLPITCASIVLLCIVLCFVTQAVPISSADVLTDSLTIVSSGKCSWHELAVEAVVNDGLSLLQRGAVRILRDHVSFHGVVVDSSVAALAAQSSPVVDPPPTADVSPPSAANGTQVSKAVATADAAANDTGNVREIEAPVNSTSGKPTGKVKYGAGVPVNATEESSGEEELTGAALTGVVSDKPGDLKALVSAVVIDGLVVVAVLFVFMILRQRYPSVYSYNVALGKAELKPGEETFFGWWRASMQLNLSDVTKRSGLDHAMLLEYFHFGSRLMAVLGVPLIAITCPLYWIYGGGNAGNDTLSWISMNNVKDQNKTVWWLYYVNALAVWYVVVATQMLVFNAQRNFIQRRFAWLKAMPKPRATTVLVEGIPEEHCTDERLGEYFQNAFGHDVVETAYVVRDTSQLLRYTEDLTAARRCLDEALFAHERDGERPSHTDHTLDHMGEELDTIDHYAQQAERLERCADAERERIRRVTANATNDEIYKSVAGAIYSRSGFVTFKHRRDSEMAVKLRLTPDEDEFCVSIPPDPSDVIYYDLQIDERVEAGRETVGYACIAGLFWSYLPVVIGLATLTSQETLRKHSAHFDHFMEANPGIAAAWDGLMGALALTLFMSFLPTFLAIIFYRFFALKAEAWLQFRLQQWYFYFLLTFVLLITAIGGSFVGFLREVLTNPSSVPSLLADTMPISSHFYLNYFPMQMVTTALVMLRYVPLSKYLALRAVIDDDKARELSEPEDQDFYGMGSRSAMATLLLVVALVYSTICPIICVFGFVYFLFCRLAYGYLFVFSESVKPDLGGAFWCAQLKHTQQGLFVYITLMTGVLLKRSVDYGPGIIAAGSFVFMIVSSIRYDHKFHWESLPFEDILEDTDNKKRKARRDTYEQPELIDDEEDEQDAVASRVSGLPAPLLANGIQAPGAEGAEGAGCSSAPPSAAPPGSVRWQGPALAAPPAGWQDPPGAPPRGRDARLPPPGEPRDVPQTPEATSPFYQRAASHPRADDGSRTEAVETECCVQ